MRFAALVRTQAISRANFDQTRFTLETEPATLSDRLMEAFGGRGWTRRKSARAMRRLRSIIERDEDRGRRVTVAAG